MSYFLRAIYSNTKWEKTLFPSWLQDGDLPSCIIKDLNADDNALSVWEITDDEANLPNVITAIASSIRRSVRNDFDYALLDTKYVDQINFNPSIRLGDTPYNDMNHYHRNLSDLSINKVVYFAHLLFAHGKFNRMGWKKLQALIKDSINNNKLDLKLVKPELKQQLDISE
jgi:hypothetical protein